MIRAVAGLNLLGGRNGPCPDGGIIAETGHCFQAHVTARHGPLVVLLKQDCADEVDDDVLVGEDARDAISYTAFAAEAAP